MKTPKFPSVKSLDGMALYYLLNGHHVSHLAFQDGTDSYCFRANVFRLKRNGWPISDQWHAGNVSELSGKRKRFKKYFISDENINFLHSTLGERLKLFIESAQQLRHGGKA